MTRPKAAVIGGKPRASAERRVRDLEQRLSEAEATIQALLSGQIDAVVDTTSHTPVLLAKAQEALQASLAEFRSLAEAMPQIVWIKRPEGATVYFNHQWMDYTGLTLEESLGDGWNKPFHPDDRQRAWDAWQRATATIGTYSVESRLRRADGVYRWWLVRGVPLRDASGAILKWFGTCTDIHDLKVAELEISRVNRALGMLSRCNGALIRARDEPDLLNEICKIVVEAGGYRMAWIGYAQDDEVRSITPVAHAGVEEGYLDEITVTWSGNEPLGQGPAGAAIRTGQAVVIDDVAQHAPFSPWLPFAQRRGYRRNISLPLRDATRTFGLLALYAAEVHHTSAEELRLLQEMADNLAFGIGNLRAESDRVRLSHQVLEQAALLDIAHDAIYVRGLDGRIIYWNKGAEQAYGWTADEAIGHRAVELLCRESSEFQEAESALLVDGAWQGEVVRRTNADRDITMAVRWTLVRDAQGEPKSILAINTDITGQKQAVETLRAAEERMRFALKSAHVGIWDMDCKTLTVRWSDTIETQYGVPAGTFGGTFKAFIECVHPDDRASVLETIGTAMKTGGEFSLLNRSTWPDGTVRWLSGAGRIVLDGDGEPVRGVGISQDVTERQALEAQYQQAQKMEAVGRLASGVAHDFNNLLTVILGFTEIVTLDVDIASQHGQDLGEIIKAGQRAAGLTKQLLAFSRQQVLRATPLDVNGLITDMVGMLTRLIGEDIKVALTLSPSLSPALVDRGQLEQVVMNLVVNARDAMPSGGSISIATAEVRLDQSSFQQMEIVPGSYVRLAVTDTGSGMTKETQRRLFEPFFTTKESGKGTGLGLSTTYGIVKQSKGYIWVDSELGRGTTFTVYLPRATADIPARLSPAGTAPVKRASETVLLVEDEIGVRLLSKRFLENAGYQVLEAANGDDAERLFGDRAETINLLVTDVMMPGCGGPELLRRLQVHKPALRVLYMSGYTEQSAVAKGGIDPDLPFVQKPFTAADFVRQVRRALDR